MIAAIFVETKGCYFGLPGVDPWDIKRDARSYRGPWPVVAHPPCERWGRFAKGSMTKQVHQVGDDGGCFESALRSLCLFGGVLEHPAHSKAWDHFGIPKPARSGWTKAGPNLWVCEVEQGHYGHKARKKTWLLACGPKPFDLIWGPAEQRLPARRLTEKGYEAARRCGIIANMCSKHRQRTPHEFRDLLISIAQHSHSIPDMPRCPQCEIDALRAHVAELEMALRDARTNLTAEGHDESLRIFWALNDINCAIN